MDNKGLPEINISLPQRIEIGRPADIGPSVFPSSVDQLKLINYSSIPAGGQVETDLRNYYRLMSKVASNTAEEQDLISLKALMVRVREYVVTEDDFNLMADSVRTTQEYLLNAIDAEAYNFSKISDVAQQLADNLNTWSANFQQEIAEYAAQGGTVGAPVIFSVEHPGNSALGYLWINNEIEEDFLAPTLSFDKENPITSIQDI